MRFSKINIFELLNPWDFLADGNVFCPNEVPLGGLLGGAGSQKDQAMVRSLEFSAPPPNLQRGEGLEKELEIGHA